MRLWYAIRRPIGYLLLTLLAWIALYIIHAIPYWITDFITGR